MNNVLVFSFGGNISQKVLEKLRIQNKTYFRPDSDDVDDYLNRLLTNNYSFIIGLGEYSGKDNDKLRIETICSNKFRNAIKGAAIKLFSISDFLKPTTNAKLTQGIGNSYCNLISYLLVKVIQNKKLHTKYGFIHIPKNFDINKAVMEIDEMINNLL